LKRDGTIVGLAGCIATGLRRMHHGTVGNPVGKREHRGEGGYWRAMSRHCRALNESTARWNAFQRAVEKPPRLDDCSDTGPF
jgi:hypothetical protein